MDCEHTSQVDLYAHSGVTAFLLRISWTAVKKISDLVHPLEEEETEKQTGQLKLAGRRGWFAAHLGSPIAMAPGFFVSSVQEAALHCVAEWGRKSTLNSLRTFPTRYLSKKGIYFFVLRVKNKSVTHVFN